MDKKQKEIFIDYKDRKFYTSHDDYERLKVALTVDKGNAVVFEPIGSEIWFHYPTSQLDELIEALKELQYDYLFNQLDG